MCDFLFICFYSQVYRYFAEKCEVSFPNIPRTKQTSLTDVVCDSSYWKTDTSTEGGDVCQFSIVFIEINPQLNILYFILFYAYLFLVVELKYIIVYI